MYGSILLVEDDRLEVERVKQALINRNVSTTVYEAANGKEALALLTLKKNLIQPDVILLSIHLPKKDGIDLLRIIKSYYRLKNISMFILTTSEEDYFKIKSEFTGINGYMLKPLRFKDRASIKSIKLLEELLQSRRD